ncbi:lytic transglycosylase domain-containing protein [Saccharomonospora saliphila]|uniref:lytic transglycosylase domain-containing protein n=1 Tax=Saccharomonospora saliphila TaxID=369829 RepID=UPI00039B6151|nr:lytic murein transglycosylase [Saccharomonospora saliphila]
MRASGMAGAARRFGLRHRTMVALLGGSLAVLPVVVVSGAAVRWLDPPATPHTVAMPLVGGYPPALSRVSVDGSLPEPPDPDELRIYEMPEVGPLGIPDTALDAYKRAARRVGGESPGCNIDWALLASIGRIESGHARGGYVDADGTTREPILGPVLNGEGPVASISDTDGGQHDGDRTWDRAVGPMQFIPSTWARWGADGNDDGVADPNNIYDATVAAGRYLCSGGVDLADPEQLRAAIYRYNNSTSYVETVVRWAEAYRSGVLSVPDSEVPRAVPEALTVDGPSADDPAAGAQLPSPSPSPDSPPSDPPEATRPESPSEDDPDGEPSDPPEDDPDGEPSDPPEDDPDGEPSDPPEDDPDGEPSDPPEDDPDGEPSDPPEDDPDGEPSDPPEDDPDGEPSDPPEDDPDGEPSDPPEDDPDGEPEDPPEDDPDGSTDPTEPCEPEDEADDKDETDDSESTTSPESETPESCDDQDTGQEPTDATTTHTSETSTASRKSTTTKSSTGPEPTSAGSTAPESTAESSATESPTSTTG